VLLVSAFTAAHNCIVSFIERYNIVPQKPNFIRIVNALVFLPEPCTEVFRIRFIAFLVRRAVELQMFFTSFFELFMHHHLKGGFTVCLNFLRPCNRVSWNSKRNGSD
jgi:hypothetical protein